MLGQQVGEIKGKATGQRVLDADGRVMETSVAANGNFVGSQVNVTLTYTSKLVTNGVLHVCGKRRIDDDRMGIWQHIRVRQ
jgi:hypothetical protein